ncbi:MAG: polysaccharide biosynthesis/export family protein [Sedimentisphaerales bacterium]|nr:polysaccharide biosynthesis/export family protein [Sedimentisphaerales bacterium]
MKSINTQRKNAKIKKSILHALLTCAVTAVALTSGCSNKFFDPRQVGRFRPVPSVNIILDSLGVAEETNYAWEEGEEPRPSDTVLVESDYVFRSGDILRVAIFELLQEGMVSQYELTVTETGKISIPDVGVVEAAGLSETQLEEEIRQILAPSILKDPSVVVTLLASQQRTFTILGEGVPGPSRYGIPRYDFRLNDAIAVAGGLRQFNVSYVYVSRAASGRGGTSDLLDRNIGIEIFEPAEEPEIGTPGEPGEDMLDIIAPSAKANPKLRSNEVIASSEMTTLGGTSLGRKSSYATADNLGGLLVNEPKFSTASSGAVIGEPLINGNPVTPLADEAETDAALTPELMWTEPQEDEQVSVADIMKTLAARSKSEETSEAATPTLKSVATVETLTPQDSVPADNPPEPAGVDEADINTIMKSLANRSGTTGPDNRDVPDTTLSALPAVNGRFDDTAGVEDILKSLENRPTETAEEGEDWQNILQSFAEPEEVEVKGEEEMNLDELLKSFAEPEMDLDDGEQTVPDDVDVKIDAAGIDVPELGNVAEPGYQEPETVMAPVVSGDQTKDAAAAQGRIEWVFENGKWVPMQVGAPAVVRPVIQVEQDSDVPSVAADIPTGVAEWDGGAKTRLIKIPADRLMAGDPRYNIVIKPGDSIYVPVDVIGEFCIMGNVVRQGYIPITGRPLTLKMAIAAAGGLGPLAWPKRVEVVRRIGRKKEEIVMVDLDKIASGEQPDFFIKPNDLINVGTHATAMWRAVLRNSFRASYGFGLVWDRNFSQMYYAGSDLWPMGD